MTGAGGFVRSKKKIEKVTNTSPMLEIDHELTITTGLPVTWNLFLVASSRGAAVISIIVGMWMG